MPQKVNKIYMAINIPHMFASNRREEISIIRSMLKDIKLMIMLGRSHEQVALFVNYMLIVIKQI